MARVRAHADNGKQNARVSVRCRAHQHGMTCAPPQRHADVPDRFTEDEGGDRREGSGGKQVGGREEVGG